MYGNLSITTATSEINETVESMSRFLTTNRNIELLEPYEGKLSRTVLRGEGGSNALDLPDNLFLILHLSPQIPRNKFRISAKIVLCSTMALIRMQYIQVKD